MTIIDAPVSIDVERLEPTIGGRVTGIDIRDLTAAGIAAIRTALLERKVLAFPHVHLSPDELIEFAGHFGDPFKRDPGYPYGPVLGRLELGQIGPSPAGRRASAWHQGGTWKPNPWPFELLQLEVVPDVGGATLWADQQAAYADLSAPLQELAGSLRAAHIVQVETRSVGADAEYVEHPLVLTHPETGIRGLYLTSRIHHLIGVSEDEGAWILDALRRHATQEKYQYRHRWSAGDLLIWDNLATQHAAIDDYGDRERWGYKISIEGGDWRPA